MEFRLGHILRQRRLQLGLSQREVARRAGIEQRQVSTFERGGEVTVSTLLKLATALETELLPVARETVGKARLAIGEPLPASYAGTAPSLLDLYGVPDDEEERQ